MVLQPKPNRPASDVSKGKPFEDATKIESGMPPKSKRANKGGSAAKPKDPLPSRIIPKVTYKGPLREAKSVGQHKDAILRHAYISPQLKETIADLLRNCSTRTELREAREVIDLIGPILSQVSYEWRREQAELRKLYVALFTSLPQEVKEKSGDAPSEAP